MDENVFTTKEKSKRAEHDLDHAEEFLIEIEERLYEIEDSFEQQAKKAFQAAWERSKSVGQQSDKMTQIAQEAREMADILDSKADNIADQAKKAKNQSVEAYEQIKAVNSIQQNISDAARKLNDEVQNAEFRLNRTREWTEDVSTEAREVKNDALALLNEVNNLILPQVNALDVRRHSEQLEEEASRLRNRSEELIREAESLRSNVEEKQLAGRDLLETGLEQQEDIEDLKNDLDFCDAQAGQAIKLWNDILQRAEGNYELITAFDTEMQQSKDLAEEALSSIPDIQAILQLTISDSRQAGDVIQNAKDNVEMALDKANEANRLADDASRKTQQIKMEAEDLRKNTTFLKDEAGFMYDRVLNTEAELKNLWDKARSNSTLVHDAKEKVSIGYFMYRKLQKLFSNC